MRRIREFLAGYGGPVFLTGAFLALAAWHYLETRTGAAASGSLWLCGMYLRLFFVLAAVIAAGGFLLWVNRGRERRAETPGKKGKLLRIVSLPETIALFLTLSFGGIYTTVLPPLSAPDEISHFMSAYAVSNRIMGKEAFDEHGYVRVRVQDDALENIYGASGDQERISLGRKVDQETYRIIYGGQKTGGQEGSSGSPNGGSGISGAGTFAGDGSAAGGQNSLSGSADGMISSVYGEVRTTPLAYLPQALGITAGRLLGLDWRALAFLGRAFNLVFFGIAVFFSVRLLPFGKWALCGVSLLPMTLHLAASYSYDAFVMGLCFLFASYCLYLAYKKERVCANDIAILAVLMAALGPCKMIYSVVMGFALLIPVKKFGGRRQWVLSAVAVLFAFAAAMIIVNRTTISTYAGGEETYLEWAGEASYTLPFVLHNPVKYGKIVYETVVRLGEEWYFTMLGSKLGNLDPVLSVPFFVTAGMTACLLGLGIRRGGEQVFFGPVQKIWIWILAGVCLLGLMTAMLIGWTPVSSQVIDGVQGRYLLPFLPFALMTLKSGRLVRTDGNDQRILYYMCLMNGYAVLRLFSIVSLRL